MTDEQKKELRRKNVLAVPDLEGVAIGAGFNVLEGSQGADAGLAVDLTPGDDSIFDSAATPGGAICAIVGQESYVDVDTSLRKTRPIFECKMTTIATFEAEYSDYYYVAVYWHHNSNNLGTYRV